MEPREMAANAAVDIWPIDTTGTTTREYSSTCVLQHGEIKEYWQRYTIPKDGKGVLG
jgi:hypothetical protein